MGHERQGCEAVINICWPSLLETKLLGPALNLMGSPQDRRQHAHLGSALCYRTLNTMGIAPGDSLPLSSQILRQRSGWNSILNLSALDKQQRHTVLIYKRERSWAKILYRYQSNWNQNKHTKHQASCVSYNRKQNSEDNTSTWKKDNPRNRIKVLMLHTLEKRKNLNWILKNSLKTR